ncbi:UPF0182 family protein [Nodosilinea nodulosa]|uniref:UPF0182 family membrane protein n=1 Tax=Nodosilinea nodulosa TaxID=416001 RepID=UPI0002E64976|nr:UPF0182 family protein [Nodosilinea nodulosa]
MTADPKLPARPLASTIAAVLLVLLMAGVALQVGIGLWIDENWFSHLGYGQVWLMSRAAPWGLGLGVFGAMALWLGLNLRLAWPQAKRPWRGLLVGLTSGAVAAIAMDHWFTFLVALFQQPVGTTDPILQHDISFYLFSLPLLLQLQRWGFWVGAGTAGLVALCYWLRFRRLLPAAQGLLVQGAQRHLLGLGGLLMLFQGLGHWLDRYTLMYSNRGSFAGANYTDVHAQMPADLLLAAMAWVGAAALFYLAAFRPALISLKAAQEKADWRWVPWQVTALLLIFGGYGLAAIGVGVFYPELVQRIAVLPNELERDRPYIEHNIAFTRAGYNLSEVDVQPFQVKDNLTPESLTRNTATLKNIRLWDNEPLLAAYRQLQEIRPYYQFPSVDVDRYTIDGDLRQVMHSARELDYTLIPERARTWVNDHFFYTHGYGLALSPVNVVTRVGLPDFFIQDIPPRATSPAAAAAFPIDNPAIYFGELTDLDVFVNTNAQELDYPKEEANIYTTYQGTGGLPIGALWQRLLYAWHFGDWQILLSQEFNPDSRFLFRRQIAERVHTLAPFLRYDRDPYLVIADGGLHWMIDAYTTSRSYPYSEPTPAGDLNYIRNAVKVVVDAYNGSVDFYLAAPDDPIIETYQRIYPSLFKPLGAMSAELRSHIRYPNDLFEVQTQQYATYHMSDAQVFYNKEDLWQIPDQIRQLAGARGEGGSEAGVNNWLFNSTLPGPLPDSQAMPPHYLILELSSIDATANPSGSAEFMLLSAFTPVNKQNLIAWMAARCDGEEYGKLLVYQFSRESLVFGPQQVEARISQNPIISEQISLWNQQGSRVNRGSLLIIPVEQSLLYVQPLYLEAENSKLPELTRVIIAYRDQVVMEPTLDQALQALFAPEAGARPGSESGSEPEGAPALPLGSEQAL